jgi:hypothetical protein
LLSGDAPGIKLKLESRSVVVVIGGKTPESNSLLFHMDFQSLLSIRTHVFQLHAWSLDADPHLLANMASYAICSEFDFGDS